MGNHWGAGRDRESAGACAVAARILAAAAVVAVSLFATGFPRAAQQPGGAAAGSIGSSILGSGAGAAPALAAGAADASGLPGTILTDARALVPFSRTLVRTVAKDGQHQLNVASAALKRPPEGSLMAPLEVLHPSSPFGLRVSPISGSAGDFHLGQDFAAACGTRVYAADGGVVRAAGWHPWGGGNRVEIDHGNGLITTYNHLEAIAVRTGDSVQVGQVIARVGTTGWSTGCHLHFETILRGKHTDPANWTLIPIKQVDELSDIVMVSYAGKSPDPSQAPDWAIPVAPDHSHTVLGGEEELLQAPGPDTVPPAASQAAPAATPPPSDLPPTATPSGSASTPPTSSAPPTPTGTAPSSPSPTTAAPAPRPTETATPSPTPTTTAPAPVTTATTPVPTTSARPRTIGPTTATPTSAVPATSELLVPATSASGTATATGTSTATPQP